MIDNKSFFPLYLYSLNLLLLLILIQKILVHLIIGLLDEGVGQRLQPCLERLGLGGRDLDAGEDLADVLRGGGEPREGREEEREREGERKGKANGEESESKERRGSEETSTIVCRRERGKEPTSSVIPVVEQRYVELHRLQELPQRSRPLGELEPKHSLILDLTPSTDEIPRMALGHLILRQVERLHAAALELRKDRAELLLAGLLRREEGRGGACWGGDAGGGVA